LLDVPSYIIKRLKAGNVSFFQCSLQNFKEGIELFNIKKGERILIFETRTTPDYCRGNGYFVETKVKIK
jgi:hypothetical protein